LHQRQRTSLFLLCWIVAPLSVLAIVAMGLFKVTAQYAFYTLPAFCLLAGAAVRGYVAHIEGRTWIAHAMRAVPLLILVADAAGYCFLYYTTQHGDRPNWRAVRDFIEREPGVDELVLTTNGPSLTYYLDPEHMQANTSRVVVQMVDWKREDGGEALPSLREDPVAYLEHYIGRARAEKRRLYVVLTEPELYEMEPSGRVDRALRTRLHQARRLPVWTGAQGMEGLVCELPDGAAGRRAAARP